MASQPAVGRTAIDFILVGKLLPPQCQQLWRLGIHRRLGQLSGLGKFCGLGIDCGLGEFLSLSYVRRMGIDRRVGQLGRMGIYRGMGQFSCLG